MNTNGIRGRRLRQARLVHTRLAPLALALSIPAAIGIASAQGFPNRPIRLIVPQAPGSASDNVSRIIATELTRQLGQQVHLMMESQNSITPHAKAGRVRGLAVTGAKRSSALPDLPTVAEAGVPGYEASTWNGIVGPAAMPKAIVARLNAEINKALGSATVRERFAAIGAEPVTATPEQFRELIRRENAKWSDVIKRSGAKID